MGDEREQNIFMMVLDLRRKIDVIGFIVIAASAVALGMYANHIAPTFGDVSESSARLIGVGAGALTYGILNRLFSSGRRA